MNNRRPLLQLGLLLLPLGVVNAIWWNPVESAVERMRPPVEQSERARYESLLSRKKPEIIILGTSIVRKNIEEDRLEKRMDKRVLKVARGAVGSAWLYLALKNVILECDPLPEMVVVCFRNYNLTIPDYRVRGRRKWLIDDMANREEALLDRLAYLEGMSSAKHLLYKYSTPYRKRTYIKQSVDRAVKAVVGHWFGFTPEEVDLAIEQTFANKKIRPEILTALQDESLVGEGGTLITGFSQAKERSFLPEMIRLAQNKNVRLVFLRMKTRKHATSGVEGRQNERLTTYIGDLGLYLESHKLDFIDLTNDPRLLPKHYDYSDYFIRGKGTTLLTDIIAEYLDSLE